jgi:hypothetical protein
VSTNQPHFPHIDLKESSSRAGVEGPRYVPVNGMSNVLGDTNTGCLVYPRDQMLQASFDFVGDTQKRDQISTVDG